jgi:integrase/recombinase XerD
LNFTYYHNGFKAYLQLEKSLSSNSIEGYLTDITKLFGYLEDQGKSPVEAGLNELTGFVHHLYKLGLAASSQARIISGIRAFYRYLKLENEIKDDPSSLLELPKLARKLPEFLSIDEVNAIIDEIDLSKSDGERNKAMLETLYSCGLRVSELVDLKISNLFLEDQFIKVIGKGDKERLVPIGSVAVKHLMIYMDRVRVHSPIQKGFEDFVFLNKFGKRLSRQMVFLIIKDLALRAGIKKNIGPHTFRHSFATHLIDGGADLRAIQEMLGHASITTTEIYTHLDRNYLRDIVLQYHPRS